MNLQDVAENNKGGKYCIFISKQINEKKIHLEFANEHCSFSVPSPSTIHQTRLNILNGSVLFYFILTVSFVTIN